MTYLPSDPLAPREPVRLPRPRPATVTVAGALMIGGAVAGLLGGLALILTAPGVGRRLRTGLATASGLPAENLHRLANGAMAFFFITGAAVAVFAIIAIALGVGVLRGNNAARFGSMVLLPLALCCGSATSLGVLGFGNGQDLRVRMDGGEVEVSGALSEAVPGWLTSLSAGLACPQVMSYLAALILLLLPAATAYFRRRPPDSAGAGQQPEAAGNQPEGEQPTRADQPTQADRPRLAARPRPANRPRPGEQSPRGNQSRQDDQSRRGDQSGASGRSPERPPEPADLRPPVDPWAQWPPGPDPQRR